MERLAEIWKDIGDFNQRQWDNVEDFFGENDCLKFVGGTFILSFGIYWLLGAIYTYMDITGKPKFLTRYKIQTQAPFPVSTIRIGNAIPQVLFNQIVIGLPYSLLLFPNIAARNDLGRTLPTFPIVIRDLIAMTITTEIFFYYSHRLLHHPRIYKYIHKRHHEWTAPISIMAEYCHPVEHIVANLFSTTIGIYIMGSHTSVAFLWVSLVIMYTLNDHSGFHFPFARSPEAHDYHHFKFNQNYGFFGILDWLHGTDENFRKTKAFQRHVISTSLTPLNELIPDK